MKAIALSEFGSADNFREVVLPIPKMKPGEVRIKVKAISLNPVDYQIRMGRPESTDARSMILGRDLSGSVDAVHESVTDLQPGDDVFCNVCNLASSGTYAEYVSVPAELVARKPAFLTHAQSAAVPVAGVTALLALNKVRAGPATSVFIAGGAGGVGSFAIPLARLMGVRKLVTTAGNATSRDYIARFLGTGVGRGCLVTYDDIVNYHDPDFIAQALERNGGPFDIAIDLVGGRMLTACCELLAVDGNLASVVDAPGHDDFETLFGKNASFHSIGAHAYSLTDDRARWRRYRDMLDHLARLFDSGDLAPPQIKDVGRLSTQVVRKAHALLESNAVQGKLAMTC